MDRTGLTEAMTQIRKAHSKLMRWLDKLDDRSVKEPSLLPGWTRGHLLTHIARNADSHVRLLTHAAKGEKVEQYVGGYEGRAAAIEAGAGRSAAELLEDVDDSAQRVFAVWEQLPRSVWDEEIVAIHGGQPSWMVVYSRWRETEIHLVDLDIGYTIDDWPDDFVEMAWASMLRGNLQSRTENALEIRATDTGWVAHVGEGEPSVAEAPAHVLVAWMTGRSIGDRYDLPELKPWI